MKQKIGVYKKRTLSIVKKLPTYMYNISLNLNILLFPLLLVAAFTLFSQQAQAAGSDPVCSLYTIHNGAISITQSEATIKVQKNEIVGLLWNGVNAATAVDSDNNTVALLGFKILTPTRDATYAYTFNDGNKKVTCRVNLEIISGSLAINEKVKSGEKILLSGRAEGVEKVVVVVYPVGSATASYTTKSLVVKNNKFSFKMPKALPDGAYRIALHTTASTTVVLATSTVVIGKAAPATLTTLVVQKVPLLSGGTVKVGSGVAVAYLQVINVGSAPARINSFSFGQIGNAPAAIMAGVSITDELGVARGSAGNMLSGTPFVGTTVTVPVVAVLAPKESRLFTVRAVVASTAAASIGQTISLALLSLSADARIGSTLPLYSVTWTVGQ